jgi:uncharacterized membrane protein YfcA
MSEPIAIVFLLAAGIVAGALGTAGAITSLVSYPALLAAGVPALAANVSNIVAGTALWPGSALASRPELAGRGQWLRRHLPFAGLGAAIGVGLLLATPAHSFSRIVPFLVTIGSLVLLLSPILTLNHPEVRRLPDGLTDAMVILVSVYAGYFGAGSGVMTLAVVLIAVNTHLPTANALKNMLIGDGSVIASIVLISLSPIDWTATLSLATGMLLGSTLGPRVTRRLPPTILRPIVAAFGLGLAAWLWLSN